MMKDKRVRMVIEFDIDAESCAEHGIEEREILDAICVKENDMIDGFEIYPIHPNLDVSMDFVLGKDAEIISKEFVNS